MNKLKILAAAAIGIIAVGLLSGCGSSSVKMADYIEIDGYSGYAKAECTLDEEDIVELLGLDKKFEKAEEKDDDDLYEDAVEELMDAVTFFGDMDIDIEPDDHIANGDTVTVTLKYDEDDAKDLGISVSPKSGKSFTIKAKDLEEVIEYDFFADCYMDYEGYNGFGTYDFTPWFDDDLKIEIEPEGGFLSNGDTITVTLTAPNGNDMDEYCAEHYGMTPEASTMTYTVEGLEVKPTMDMFEGLDISVSGASGAGVAMISGGVDGCKYVADKTDKLANGDVITITVEPQSSDYESIVDMTLDKYDSLPENGTMEYTVEGLSEYAMKLADIPEKALNELTSYVETTEKEGKAKTVEENPDEIAAAEADYIGCYFVARNDGIRSSGNNKLYIMTKYTCTFTDGEAVTGYRWYSAEDIIVNPDGTLNITTSDLEPVTLSQFFGVVFGGGFIEHDCGFPGTKTLDEFVSSELGSYSSGYNIENTISE